MELLKTKSTLHKTLQIAGLIIVNLLLMVILGFLTLDSMASFNSRIGGFLLSFFIPIFIVYRTQTLSNKERLLQYGVGMMLYAILILVRAGISAAISTALLPCLIVALATLYFGDKALKN